MRESVAKYKEICLWIKERLESGELHPGDKIESEYQLCSHFHVSRQTVRHAIAVLEEEGLYKDIAEAELISVILKKLSPRKNGRCRLRL